MAAPLRFCQLVFHESNWSSIYPDQLAFPASMDSLLCSDDEIGGWGRALLDSGLSFGGLWSGASGRYTRALALAMGRESAAARYAPDMRQHCIFGDRAQADKANQQLSL